MIPAIAARYRQTLIIVTGTAHVSNHVRSVGTSIADFRDWIYYDSARRRMSFPLTYTWVNLMVVVSCHLVNAIEGGTALLDFEGHTRPSTDPPIENIH